MRPFDPQDLVLVKKVAYKLRPRIPRQVDTGELLGDGAVGLVDALRLYNRRKSKNFEAYAAQRIRGAILDGLRERDMRNRRDRREGQPLEFFPAAVLANRHALTESPFAYAVRRERHRHLARCIRTLPIRHRRVVVWHSLLGIEQQAIARRWRLDPSRVQQIHAEAVVMLRRRMAVVEAA
jgi:RNA polymerase sigma factor (sigma-70 family)